MNKTTQAPPGTLSLKSLHHVALSVADMDRSIEWYERVLDANVRLSYQMPDHPVRIAFLELGGDIELELIEFEGSQAYPTGSMPDEVVRTQGYAHIAFAVDDVVATTELLRRRGAGVAWEPRDWAESSLRTANLLDPDGNIVELVEPLEAG